MRIISYSTLKQFSTQHPTAETSLNSWYKIIKQGRFANFHEIKATFPSADVVLLDKGKKLTVFNIGGNDYRLIVSIHYNTQCVYIRDVLTHAEYSKNRWKH